ncbi:MAG TPA: hypothetical protein VMW80_03590 [Candidatus Dormibacteraeota bacterium]|nr:hypothetical protein [Candidatus Dormibacteraeota bacterium]
MTAGSAIARAQLAAVDGPVLEFPEDVDEAGWWPAAALVMVNAMREGASVRRHTSVASGGGWVPARATPIEG